MRRLFGGSKKPEVKGPTLSEATQRIDTRCESLDTKIKQLDTELVRYREQLSKMRPGGAQHQLKQRAMQTLKRKKMYEAQRDQLYNQSFNMEQTNFATQTLQDTMITVDAMRSANKEMKVQFKHVDVDSIEDLHDEMADLLDQNDEIQEVLSRSYNMPEVDDAELEDELASLGEELQLEESGEVPDYLTATSAPTTDPMASLGGTDPYGLPAVPQQGQYAL